jgi:hypothetical protein
MARIIRVMLREMPQMLRDILENTIAGQPDMRLVCDTPAGGAEDHGPPDVVIVRRARVKKAEPPGVLLRRWPAVRVLTIEARGRRAFTDELRPYRTELRQPSPTELVRAIRTAVRTASSPADRPVTKACGRSH